MFFIGISETLLFITIASFFGALGQGSGLPSIQAHCVKSVSKEMAGVATSTVMIGQNVGNAIAPVIGSFFIKPFGYGAAFCGFGSLPPPRHMSGADTDELESEKRKKRVRIAIFLIRNVVVISGRED